MDQLLSHNTDFCLSCSCWSLAFRSSISFCTLSSSSCNCFLQAMNSAALWDTSSYTIDRRMDNQRTNGWIKGDKLLNTDKEEQHTCNNCSFFSRCSLSRAICLWSKQLQEVVKSVIKNEHRLPLLFLYFVLHCM